MEGEVKDPTKNLKSIQSVKKNERINGKKCRKKSFLFKYWKSIKSMILIFK